MGKGNKPTGGKKDKANMKKKKVKVSNSSLSPGYSNGGY